MRMQDDSVAAEVLASHDPPAVLRDHHKISIVSRMDKQHLHEPLAWATRRIGSRRLISQFIHE